MSESDELKQLARMADERGDKETALAALRKLDAMTQVDKPVTREATPIDKVRASIPGRIMQGVADPGLGTMQLLSKIPGVDKSDILRNQMKADYKFQGVNVPDELLPKSVDQFVRGNEKSYQEARQATQPRSLTSLITGNNDPGFDAARLVGNIVSPANLLASSRIPQAATLAGRVGYGVAGGAGTAAMQPVTKDDYWSEKQKQIGTGAAVGGLAPVVIGGIARMVQPNTRPEVRQLLDEGVTPTPGQILGGAWQTTEDKATSLPITGDAIRHARGQSLDEFNRALYARALAPINGHVPREAGRDSVRDVREQLNDAFDQLLPQLRFRADPQFATEFNQLRTMAAQLPRQQAEQFERTVETQLTGKMTPQGLMNGERFKEVESELGRLARGYRGDSSFDNRQLGAAIGQLQTLLRDNLSRTNPQHANELARIREGWAIYTRLRHAAASQGSADGRLTPAQLSAAVRHGDDSLDHRAFSEGTALTQDLSDAGKNVLASKYPDSGSIGRLALGMGTAGSALLEPTALAATGLASLPYLPGGRQAMAALLARRPNVARPIAENLRRAVPYITPSAATLANILSQPSD